MLRLFGRPLLMLAGLVAVGAVVRLLPGTQATALLRAHGHWTSLREVAEFVALGAVLCAVGVPRQLVAYAAGLAAGVWLGIGAALVAQILGCALNFFWARWLARDWATARLRGRLQRLDRMLGRRPFVASLTLRLLPVGNNLLLNLAAGISSIAAVPFLAASAIGYVPQTAVFALAGSGTAVGAPGRLALAVVLVAASAGLGYWLLRKGRVANPVLAEG
jgi:uncharacterized membrane protein YdjX (TVP38/TMEM64 family)